MVLDAYGSILVHPNQNLVTLNAETARGARYRPTC